VPDKGFKKAIAVFREIRSPCLIHMGTEEIAVGNELLAVVEIARTLVSNRL
jgi:hypothetical protein